MINPTMEDLGERVVYNPLFPGLVNGRGERGILVSFSPHYAHVKYDGDRYAKGVDLRDLNLE